MLLANAALQEDADWKCVTALEWTRADFDAAAAEMATLQDREAGLALAHYAAQPALQWVMVSPRLICTLPSSADFMRGLLIMLLK